MATVGEELLDEIERVSAKRERWRPYLDEMGPAGAMMGLTIGLMTGSIEAAKRAVASCDAVECIACLQDLRGYGSDD